MSVKSILSAQTRQLRAHNAYGMRYQHLDLYQKELESKGWTFYVVDQTRGFCRKSDRVITIPAWCYNRPEAYLKQGKPLAAASAQRRLVQYILHEIAHAIDWERNKQSSGHNKPFMDILIEICPAELLVYEMTYKPANLVKAGAVFCPDSLNF